jgi:hypothetical protein
VPIVVSLSVPDFDYVAQVEDGIASHVGRIHYAVGASALSFKTQLRPESPVRLKVFRNLAVDGANCAL